ncbi:hypothetical protein J2T12_000767 [Paenibacillus anaericanus]|uniref:S-layer homology domain-containing protein n=1 Tax=Paenibacillus anaericanus TaxID=170367 RepID=UPI0027832FBD|nr:S-layer homology domain-containing protein [Paenibacillus anaericanus]MDQ0087373.1 hypothetical protein [Paenibacillus anaericanus]
MRHSRGRVEAKRSLQFYAVSLSRMYLVCRSALLEIVLGDNGKFNPDEPVTRGEFVAMIYRALNLTK